MPFIHRNDAIHSNWARNARGAGNTVISISDPCACQGDLLHLRSAETLKGIWRGGYMKEGADIYWEYNNVEWKEGLQ